MAENYKVLASNRTVLVRGANLVVDVMDVHAVTTPSGVTFSREVPYKTWEKSGAHAALEPIATHIEHIMTSRPHVVAGNAVQDVGANGLITNLVEFVVRIDGTDASQPGPFESTVTIPVQVLHDEDSFDRYFSPTVKALTALAAS